MPRNAAPKPVRRKGMRSNGGEQDIRPQRQGGARGTEYKVRHIPFEGKWRDAFDLPERKGVWLIWGNSANGKTTFAMQLCKYLCQFGRVAYNSMEEGFPSR